MQQKFKILLLVAMVLVAAGFTMRHTRFGRTGVMVLMALGLGFALYFVRNFAQVLGENGQIPPLLAAWGPPSAAARKITAAKAILASSGLLSGTVDPARRRPSCQRPVPLDNVTFP